MKAGNVGESVLLGVFACGFLKVVCPLSEEKGTSKKLKSCHNSCKNQKKTL